MTTHSSGILLVDKPTGLTSAAVVGKLKRHFGWKKVGHAGTLDPFASGLLVLLIGEATKISKFLLGGDKEYDAIGEIGFETNTGDLEGEKSGTVAKPAPPTESWENSLSSFVGEISQIPPQYSAIKHKGKALYRYARAGERIEVQARTTTIHALKIIDVNQKHFRFLVSCKGGTYIRTLAEDWAKSVGTHAHLVSLRRLRVSNFLLDSAHSMQSLLDLPNSSCPELVGLESALKDMPRIICPPTVAKQVAQGNLIVLNNFLSDRLPKHTEEESNTILLMREAPQQESHRCLALISSTSFPRPAYSIDRVFH